jgi:hypothetical protein
MSLTTQAPESGTAASLSTPVLFLVFNRPEPTRRVFHAIRAARPARLFIAADGPRAHRPDDEALCQEVRAIVTAVDWPCRVETLFRERNLGGRVAVSEAMDWFFSHVDEGIILEDDVLPSAQFFPFCEELLNHYRDDPSVMMIAGTNPACHRVDIRESYAFSGYALIWGWATWKRAWKAYDVDISTWPTPRGRAAVTQFHAASPRFSRMWFDIFDGMKAGRRDSWCYQWSYALMLHKGCSVVPAGHLVTNIGFGVDATHTTGSPPAWMSRADRGKVGHPLIHPANVRLRRELDRKIGGEVYGLTTWAEWKFALKRLLIRLRLIKQR